MIETGGSAFPYQDYRGMTLRDWFAGQALSNLDCLGRHQIKFDAEKAYEIADAMLEARKKEKPNATNNL
jgi:hypothetical protein